MTIVLLEIYDGPVPKGVRQAVSSFRRSHPEVMRSVLRTHRSRSDRELADFFNMVGYPAFVFTNEKGDVLAEVDGKSLRAIQAAYAKLNGVAVPARPKRKVPVSRRSRFAIQNPGYVEQRRRDIIIEGLPADFCPSPSALEKAGCISWQRDQRGKVTASFGTIKVADRTFTDMLNKGALGIEKALPAESLWTSERISRG